MTLKTKLLAAGAALLLSTGAALAVPATAQTDLSVRSGPGTKYPVIRSIPGGETVDVGRCTGSWCRVSFAGGSGFARRSYLAFGGAPGPAVAVSPYVYDDDYGYAYGPSAFIYANPRFRHRHHGWQGRPSGDGGNWAGRPGRPGGSPPLAGQPPGSGFAGPPAHWQRPGSGIGAGGARVGGSGFNAPRVVAPSAPAGGGGAQPGFAGSMVRGGAGGGFSAPSVAAPSAPAGGGGAQPGFAGSLVRGQR